MNSFGNVDLTAIIAEHFIKGDEGRIDIEDDVITVYRRRNGGEFELIAQVNLPIPASSVLIDPLNHWPWEMGDFSESGRMNRWLKHE